MSDRGGPWRHIDVCGGGGEGEGVGRAHMMHGSPRCVARSAGLPDDGMSGARPCGEDPTLNTGARLILTDGLSL